MHWTSQSCTACSMSYSWHSRVHGATDCWRRGLCWSTIDVFFNRKNGVLKVFGARNCHHKTRKTLSLFAPCGPCKPDRLQISVSANAVLGVALILGPEEASTVRSFSPAQYAPCPSAHRARHKATAAGQRLSSSHLWHFVSGIFAEPSPTSYSMLRRWDSQNSPQRPSSAAVN